MGFRIIGRRISFVIGSMNMSYCFRGEGKNKFITLGVNCFPRTKLTKFGLKARKSDGELTYPFDLCAIPLKSVAEILKNDFCDYFDDLSFDKELNIWVNKKYSIKYFHDKNLEKEKFYKRYKARIENFRQKTAAIKNPVFISAIFNETYDKALYNDISQSLRKYCGLDKDFKYLVVNIKTKVDIENIISDGNIFYKEILEPCSNYSNIWTDTSLDKKIPKMYDFYSEYVNFVKMFI